MKTYKINVRKGSYIFDGGKNKHCERKAGCFHPVNFNTNVHIKK